MSLQYLYYDKVLNWVGINYQLDSNQVEGDEV